MSYSAQVGGKPIEYPLNQHTIPDHPLGIRPSRKGPTQPYSGPADAVPSVLPSRITTWPYDGRHMTCQPLTGPSSGVKNTPRRFSYWTSDGG